MRISEHTKNGAYEFTNLVQANGSTVTDHIFGDIICSFLSHCTLDWRNP